MNPIERIGHEPRLEPIEGVDFIDPEPLHRDWNELLAAMQDEVRDTVQEMLHMAQMRGVDVSRKEALDYVREALIEDESVRKAS